MRTQGGARLTPRRRPQGPRPADPASRSPAGRRPPSSPRSRGSPRPSPHAPPPSLYLVQIRTQLPLARQSGTHTDSFHPQESPHFVGRKTKRKGLRLKTVTGRKVQHRGGRQEHCGSCGRCQEATGQIGGHLVRDANVYSLRSTPEANTVLYVKIQKQKSGELGAAEPEAGCLARVPHLRRLSRLCRRPRLGRAPPVVSPLLLCVDACRVCPEKPACPPPRCAPWPPPVPSPSSLRAGASAWPPGTERGAQKRQAASASALAQRPPQPIPCWVPGAVRTMANRSEIAPTPGPDGLARAPETPVSTRPRGMRWRRIRQKDGADGGVSTGWGPRFGLSRSHPRTRARQRPLNTAPEHVN